MESPPSSSSWSQPFILSDDSGLLLTTGSFSSGNTSIGSGSKGERRHFHYEDSDCEEKSLSQDDSLDGMSDVICGENFNTLKKGPHWTDVKQSASPIEPPLEFQDRPRQFRVVPAIDFFCERLTSHIIEWALLESQEEEILRLSSPQLTMPHPISPPPLPSRTIHCNPPPIRPLPELPLNCHHNRSILNKSASYLVHTSPYKSYLIQNSSFPSPTSNFANSATNFASSASPYVSHTPRPSSRSSLGGSSRLSSSHNSLSVQHMHRVDDSSFITQAVSHDTLSSNQISDLYNVPFDSDMYAVPVDVVKKSTTKTKRADVYTTLRGGNLFGGVNKKRRRNVQPDERNRNGRKSVSRSEKSQWSFQAEPKRHSVAGTSSSQGNEPIHMSLQEVRNYLQTLYSSGSDSSDIDYRGKNDCNTEVVVKNNNNNKYHLRNSGCIGYNQGIQRPKKSTFLFNIKTKKVKDSSDNPKTLTISPVKKEEKKRKVFSFRQALCNIFRFRKFLSVEDKTEKFETEKHHIDVDDNHIDEFRHTLSSRALPPLPNKEDKETSCDVEQALDFATSIQRVKDYGWYWGPISSEAAEKILSNEPDGSFIVRDSSDDHYIFSLTFKLNNSVRHVRIEHDQGNFSFGSCTKFKSQTIVEFIENAVEHSRSGRYLFFLHRRPVIGPVRVQLLHPVSRFKQVQSLQHMCRFVIHKNVRRDLIPELPLPRRMIDYLNTPHYYSEHFVDVGGDSGEEAAPPSSDNVLRSSFVPPVPSGFSNVNERNVVNSNNTNTNDSVSVSQSQNVPVNEYIVISNNSSRHTASNSLRQS